MTPKIQNGSPESHPTRLNRDDSILTEGKMQTAEEVVPHRVIANRQIGSADAAVLLERHRTRLMATARSLLGYRGDAEDLVQTTFEVAIRHISELRDESAIWSWLVTIETHEAFRWRRRLSRSLLKSQDLSRQFVHDSSTSLELRDALSRLSPRIRTAVVLHYMADLTTAQTAMAMGVSENTVKTQLKTGLRQLKEALREIRD
jgi:RNA polymerase sigma-70 factor (ECF subfamily)